MTCWAPGTTEFPMKGIPDRRAKTFGIHVPPPVREILGNPEYIKFVIRGKKVTVEGTSK